MNGAPLQAQFNFLALMLQQCNPEVREQMFPDLEEAFPTTGCSAHPYWHGCMGAEKLSGFGSVLFTPATGIQS